MTFPKQMIVGAALALYATTCLAVDLAEVFDLAVENDPELGVAEATYLARRQVVGQTRAGILPTVSVGGSTDDNMRRFVSVPGNPSEEFNNHGWQAALNQPIFRLDRWYRFRQARDIEAQAMAQFAIEQQNLIARVADTYLTILESNDALTAANAEREAVKRQLEQVQQRFDVGLVAITDVLDAQAQFDNSTVNVINAEGAQDISFQSLLRLTGERFNAVDALAEEFPVRHPEPAAEEEWVSAALENNYQLAAAREAVDVAKKEVQIARAGHLPTVDAQALWQHSSSGAVGFFGAGIKIDQRIYGLQMNMPIYQGGGVRANVRQTRFQQDQATQTLELTERTVVEQTRSLIIAISTDVARVRARLRGIESAQSALDATQTGYEVGTRNIVDVLQAQQRLFLTKFQYAQARYNYIRNTLALKQIVGSLSPDDVYALNNYVQGQATVNRISPTTR